ncbi:MAG: DUF4180 domain-containing protein [Pseudohongiellaceae bacterium]
MNIPPPPDVASLLDRSFATDVLILHEDELGEHFFRLRKGLLGELFQKLTNYDQKVALIVPDHNAHGERLRQLINEHRSHPTIRFFPSMESATIWAQKIIEEQR